MRARRLGDLGWESVDVRAPHEGCTAVPGLVDIHVHGVSGMDVMDGQSAEIAKALRAFGVEYICPTTVTASWDDLDKLLASIEPFEGFAGVHLEGPHISAEKPGAQPAQHISTLSQKQLEPHIDRIRIVTLAPEIEGSGELIRWLVSKNVRVSAGHTNATYEQLQATPGIDQMTHFYNAMRPFSHREPGCVGFGLLADVDCELIYDRMHVSMEAAHILFKCKSNDRVIGVSDGTKLSGTPQGATARMWGHEVVNENGSARLGDGTLAGSSSTLANVFTNLWQDLGPEAAIMACAVNPRRRLGLPEPNLWLLVDGDGAILRVTEGRMPA